MKLNSFDLFSIYSLLLNEIEIKMKTLEYMTRIQLNIVLVSSSLCGGLSEHMPSELMPGRYSGE